MVVAFTGGGTLGHVIPALTVYEKLKELEDIEAFYIGCDKEEDRKTVQSCGLEYYAVSTGKLRRYFSLRNLSDLGRVAAGFFQARRILKKRRPDVLFSKGGFVSVPAVLAAASLHIRIVTHESDFSLGLANRINSRFASVLCLGFAGKAAERANAVVTGNPVRPDIVRAAQERIRAEDDFILVLGGSQGAAQINRLVYDNLERLTKRYRIYHQCGKSGDLSVRSRNYTQTEFIHDGLAQLMARAKLIVSRAGANAVSEICTLGKASLLIPLSAASRGDQVENAGYLLSHDAAAVSDGSDFVEKICLLMDDNRLNSRLARNAAQLAQGDAALRIARIISGDRNDFVSDRIS